MLQRAWSPVAAMVDLRANLPCVTRSTERCTYLDVAGNMLASIGNSICRRQWLGRCAACQQSALAAAVRSLLHVLQGSSEVAVPTLTGY